MTTVGPQSVFFALVAHAPLASSLRSVALHVHPDCSDDLLAVDVLPNWSAEQVVEALTAVSEAASGRPLLVLVDVFGATPANGAGRFVVGRPDAAAVAGVNVPMLWRALGYRHLPLREVEALCMQGGAMGLRILAAAD
ncbi:PTS sugar transporter subunit IIA [Inhella crocodyli]|uniref:PTS fructose transporter subunit IIA n=1 Tax=Inhella crocodyli TaxID=2499851 RepID=A0A3S2XTZ7_9BURK|nr:PTS fructose transporter subunit IIA [Inhella crocodyli]RVT84614.1 PTS fructose transporter subunit IIA [Inhella crocodyli]